MKKQARERERERERDRKTREKRRKGSRPILEILRAALLRSVRGQHDRKNGFYEGSAQGKWNSSERSTASRLSCFLPAYLSHLLRLKAFLNASFYRVYSSFWNLTLFSLHARLVFAQDGLLLIKSYFFLSSFRMG